MFAVIFFTGTPRNMYLALRFKYCLYDINNYILLFSLDVIVVSLLYIVLRSVFCNPKNEIVKTEETMLTIHEKHRRKKLSSILKMISKGNMKDIIDTIVIRNITSVR